MKNINLTNTLKIFFRKPSAVVILIAAALLLFSSCMPGKRTARTFIEKKEEIAVMIVPPTYTFLYYYPYNYNFESESPDEGEDLTNSHFLKEIDLERATQLFTDALLEGLKKYDIKVFGPEQFDLFLSQAGERFIFTTAQTELVESDRLHTDRALIDTTLYRQDFLLRTVERNTWFEFTQVDEQEEEADMKVLYSTFFTADNVEGRFRYRGLTGEVNYEYSSYLINMKDIYSLHHFAGIRNARYIFDFLLNRHVEQNASPFLSQPADMRYLQNHDKLIRSRDDQQFIILEQ